jgi:hypothetical protein
MAVSGRKNTHLEPSAHSTPSTPSVTLGVLDRDRFRSSSCDTGSRPTFTSCLPPGGSDTPTDAERNTVRAFRLLGSATITPNVRAEIGLSDRFSTFAVSYRNVPALARYPRSPTGAPAWLVVIPSEVASESGCCCCASMDHSAATPQRQARITNNRVVCGTVIAAPFK